jgi:hypothetical protein
METEWADGCVAPLADGRLSIPHEGSTMRPKYFLRTPEAAAFLQARYRIGAARSLAKWRVTGEGPPFRRLQRIVLYDPDDLVSWAEARLSAPLHSTSEIRNVPAPREIGEPLAQSQWTGPSPVVRRPRGRPRKANEPILPQPVD